MTSHSFQSLASTFARFAAPLYLLFAVLPVPSAVAQEHVSDGQRLALLSKPAVVRIVDGYTATFTFRSSDRGNLEFPVTYGAMGSGAFINHDGYAVTNAHVVRRTKEGDDDALDQLFLIYCVKLYQAYNLDPRTVLNSVEKRNFVSKYSSYANFKHFHHVVLPNGDSLPFEIKAFGAPIGQGGKDVAILKVELKNAPVLLFGDSELVQLQDHITVVGYPGAADTVDSGLLDAKSWNEASITDGKVSAKKTSSEGAPILQVSAPATHGNSGGPVLSDSARIVGLLTFGGDKVDGQEISGFAFAIPSSTVLEFVKQAGTTNEEGMVDVRYREGLDLFFEGYFGAAMEKFEEVRRLYPQHSEAARLSQECQVAIGEGRERTDVPVALIVGIAVAVVAILFLGFLVVAAIVTVVVLRRSKRAKANPRPQRARAPSYAWTPAPTTDHYTAPNDPLATRISSIPDQTMVMGTMPLGSKLDSTSVN